MSARPHDGEENAMDGWTTLVDAETVAAALGDPALVPVDARAAPGGPDAGRRAWLAAHLPGAGHVHLDEDLSDLTGPAEAGRHPLPSPAAFARVLSRLGIGPESQVVVYDGGDGAMAAARFWWLLRLAGHRRVAVLDGGFARWQALGLPVEAGPVPARDAPVREIAFDPAAIATTAEIATRLGRPRGWLLDVRAPERFRGEVEPLDPVAGHIPGAVNRPFAANLRDGRFLPKDELRAQIEPLLAGTPPRDVVVSCGSGVTACQLLLAMEHAGLGGARVYAPSWSGWVADRARPVETGA